MAAQKKATNSMMCMLVKYKYAEGGQRMEVWLYIYFVSFPMIQVLIFYLHQQNHEEWDAEPPWEITLSTDGSLRLC